MRKRFTEEQTIQAVKRLEGGTSPKDLSREMGVTQQTLYHWKKKIRRDGCRRRPTTEGA